MISSGSLKEFKKIYVEEFGKKISDSEATGLAVNLLTIFNHVYRPIQKDRAATFSDS